MIIKKMDAGNAYGISDAAKRASETITMHAIAGGRGKFVAIRLADGGSDNVLYDTRDDAIKHQLFEEYCCYVFVPPCGMTVKEAEAYLQLNRDLYDAGWHMCDPALINPVRIEDARKKAARLKNHKVR